MQSLNQSNMPYNKFEKAYAKIHGYYKNLISGYLDEGVQALKGFQPEKILINNEKTGVFPNKMIRPFRMSAY